MLPETREAPFIAPAPPNGEHPYLDALLSGGFTPGLHPDLYGSLNVTQGLAPVIRNGACVTGRRQMRNGRFLEGLTLHIEDRKHMRILHGPIAQKISTEACDPRLSKSELQRLSHAVVAGNNIEAWTSDIKTPLPQGFQIFNNQVVTEAYLHGSVTEPRWQPDVLAATLGTCLNLETSPQVHWTGCDTIRATPHSPYFTRIKRRGPLAVSNSPPLPTKSDDSDGMCQLPPYDDNLCQLPYDEMPELPLRKLSIVDVTAQTLDKEKISNIRHDMPPNFDIHPVVVVWSRENEEAGIQTLEMLHRSLPFKRFPESKKMPGDPLREMVDSGTVEVHKHAEVTRIGRIYIRRGSVIRTSHGLANATVRKYHSVGDQTSNGRHREDIIEVRDVSRSFITIPLAAENGAPLFISIGVCVNDDFDRETPEELYGELRQEDLADEAISGEYEGERPEDFNDGEEDGEVDPLQERSEFIDYLAEMPEGEQEVVLSELRAINTPEYNPESERKRNAHIKSIIAEQQKSGDESNLGPLYDLLSPSYAFDNPSCDVRCGMEQDGYREGGRRTRVGKIFENILDLVAPSPESPKKKKRGEK